MGAIDCATQADRNGVVFLPFRGFPEGLPTQSSDGMSTPLPPFRTAASITFHFDFSKN